MNEDELPALDERGRLPEGIHRGSETEFHSRFVERMEGSDTRQLIWDGFQGLREQALEYDIDATQWVNGSFVTSKPDPGDIDVVTFMEYDEIEALPDEAREFVFDHLGGEDRSRRTYRTDAYLVPSCTEGHHYYGAFNSWRLYWRRHFGHISDPADQEHTMARKGFVELTLRNPERVPQIDRDES